MLKIIVFLFVSLTVFTSCEGNGDVHEVLEGRFYFGNVDSTLYEDTEGRLTGIVYEFRADGTGMIYFNSEFIDDLTFTYILEGSNLRVYREDYPDEPFYMIVENEGDFIRYYNLELPHFGFTRRR